MKIKLNIAQKLIVGFGLVLLAIIINGVSTFVTLSNNRSLSNEITGIYGPSIQNVQHFKDLVNSSKSLIKSWVFIDRQPGTSDKVRLETLQSEDYPKIKEEFELIKDGWSKSDQDSLANVMHKTDSLFVKQQYIMSNLNSFEAYDDVMVIFEVEPMVQEDGEIITLSNEIIQSLTYLETKFSSLNSTSLDDMDASFQWFSIFVLVMIFVLIIISGAVAYVLYVSIVKPLNKGVTFAQTIGKGDLTAELNIDQNDEIGLLAEALNGMAANLKSIVISIKENANNLVSSSDNVKGSSLQLSKGSADQAASAEEVSTSIEEMVANIDQNTDNAVETEKITVETAKDVNIADKLSSSAASSMKGVAEKITIIGDIAFQTNILALNAAVEAARAGEHGKGFSVVAAEVRKLAERSKIAADEIHELVNTGLKVSSEAGEKARLLVPDIEKTTQLIKEISAASIEQKTGAEQINMAMQQLNLITQENASSSDELTQSAEQLAGLAESLKEAVSFFKIGEDVEDEVIIDDKAETEDTLADVKESEPIDKNSKFKQNPTKENNIINLDKDFDMDNYEKF